jgi:hypothetical protein
MGFVLGPVLWLACYVHNLLPFVGNLALFKNMRRCYIKRYKLYYVYFYKYVMDESMMQANLVLVVYTNGKGNSVIFIRSQRSHDWSGVKVSVACLAGQFHQHDDANEHGNLDTQYAAVAA